MKNYKNLILAIHIDSAELNLSVGFVDNNVVSILAYKSYIINGIDKGGINESKNFEVSFSSALADFLNSDCKVLPTSLDECKKKNIDTDDHGFLAIKKYAINILNSESNELGGLLQSDIIKKVLKRFIQGNLELIDGETIFSCTSDTAVTNLLCSNCEDQYIINILFGRYSTSLNFITNKNSLKLYSKKIEIGVQDLLNSLNESDLIKLDSEANFNEVYQFLKRFRFTTSKIQNSVKIKFIRNYFIDIHILNNIFTAKLQYILHHCYNQFCSLDTEKVRFKPNFLNNVRINILGYMADFEYVAECVSLVFSHKLKEEMYLLEKQNKNSDNNITTQNNNSNQVNLNLVTGEQSFSFLPTLTEIPKEIIYKDPNFENIIFAYTCKVQNHYNDLTKLTVNLKTANRLRSNIDQFAATFGLIYNFYIIQPDKINTQPKSIKSYLQQLFKFRF